MLSQIASESNLRHIPLSYNNADSQGSALRLLFTLFPEWEHAEGEIKFIRFTDGITNTLLKATKRRPGWTEEQIDSDAVLLRAYGKGTEVLIDRERETASHLLLAARDLAPPLLARFQNGMLYRFIQGKVCSSTDLGKEPIWRAVARRLGQWHAVLPVLPGGGTSQRDTNTNDIPFSIVPSMPKHPSEEINAITPGKVTPNLWTVTQKWIFALPTNTEAERKRKAVLQQELEKIVDEFVDLPGLGSDGLVLSHCDLLSGNIIVQPRSSDPTTNATPVETVSFIDYEYATPGPAAFDIANHFSEFGGLACDYGVLPTRSVRHAFLSEYLSSYSSHLGAASEVGGAGARSDQGGLLDLDNLFAAVDRFRGLPGFYWGVWALIQATISQIDFDYAAYAEHRLGEYWAWKEEVDGSREKKGREMSLRERRWAEE